MGDDLESRLKSHARAFEGLMSLIPAEKYYGKDESITSTQWQKTKKQSREERQANKRAKLDPASHKSAKDIMDENARKRKRELEGEAAEPDSSDIDMDIEKEKPMEGLKSAVSKAKKQKTTEEAAPDAVAEKQPTVAATPQEKAKVRADKRRAKAEKKREKQEQQKSKVALQKEFGSTLVGPADTDAKAEASDDDEDEDDDGDALGEQEDEKMQALDVSGLADDPITTETPDSAHSNASPVSLDSAASSVSSIVPSTTPGSALVENKDKDIKPFKYDPTKQAEYQSRLAAKLESLRAARKADGPDGRPARNRAELIEARRKKEAARQVTKKAGRQVAKEDEERAKAEEQLARIRGGSGSPSILNMRSTPEKEANLAFGKVAWNDGQQLEGSLSGFLEQRKKKGKSDARTALEAAEKKKERLGGMDEAKRKDIEEKDLWLNAKKRAQGEKVHDDTTLLKKSVKRQEKEKAQSKQAWKERLTTVVKGKAQKQKKRETNLQKRRDEKGTKKGKKVKKPAKKRAGFEGTFKGK